ncbi:Acetyltransferase (isoleucine patch superfamily) [Microbacterium sp. ru370.1]|uniref:acyltransferase n=1 Tax=unclassified Microbacterium TaxID=2609290 RepID=UPI0008821E4E|nr:MULTISPECIES: acyltransferase [unclassified Microbacterium]SDO44849.1 Acetyltransferase (isoleucine patch superfamily) [Microbacterium sp. ru370.1]SIT81126.1 Acetyltransferase (isoleucine patch superfamily) [Microbacterium sp. RU1D]
MGIAGKIIHEQRERLREAGSERWRIVSAQLAGKVGPMAVRGALLAPRLGTSHGLPLIGRGVRVRNPHLVHAGRDLVVEDFAEIQGLSRDGIRFGNGVSIGTGTLIRPSSYYSRAIGVGLVMGDGSSLSPGCYIGCSGGVTIGEKTMLGPGVRVFAEDHVMSDPSLDVKSQGVEWSPIAIGSGCWIASGVTITSGVTIGDGAVVAAGAVVTRDVPAGAVYGGIPARELKSRGVE